MESNLRRWLFKPTPRPLAGARKGNAVRAATAASQKTAPHLVGGDLGEPFCTAQPPNSLPSAFPFAPSTRIELAPTLRQRVMRNHYTTRPRLFSELSKIKLVRVSRCNRNTYHSVCSTAPRHEELGSANKKQKTLLNLLEQGSRFSSFSGSSFSFT